ncbi:unnamed protein product, partial [Polarella glacialis]
MSFKMHGQGGQGDCWDFQRGRCAKGDRCRWLHAPPAARPGTGVINAQDWNASEEDAARALCQVVQGELELLKDNNNDGFSAAEGAPAGLWEPFVEIASDAPLRAVLEEITARVAQVCGVELPSSVNLNFYPPGGGVGLQAPGRSAFGERVNLTWRWIVEAVTKRVAQSLSFQSASFWSCPFLSFGFWRSLPFASLVDSTLRLTLLIHFLSLIAIFVLQHLFDTTAGCPLCRKFAPARRKRTPILSLLRKWRHLEQLNTSTANVPRVQSVYRASKIRKCWFACIGGALLIQALLSVERPAPLHRCVPSPLSEYRVMRGWLARSRSKALKFERNRRLNKEFFEHCAAVIQKFFRGWWSRRHLHDYHGRKRYLATVEKRGEWTSEYLAREHQEKLSIAKQEEERQMRQEFDNLAGELHHLVSTKTIAGVYNPPYNDTLPRAFEKPIEQHLRDSCRVQMPKSLRRPRHRVAMDSSPRQEEFATAQMG